MQAIMETLQPRSTLFIIYCWYNRMSKVLAKGGSPLKFDTSSGNLDCFIHTTTLPLPPRRPSYAQPFKNRKRSRPARQQQMEFQDKAFLESVLTKILNDADCKGITDLIDSMVFPTNTPADIDAARDPHSDANDHDEISKVFSDFQPFNKNNSSLTANVFEANCHLYRVLPPTYQRPTPCTLYNYEEMAEGSSFHNSLLDSTAISPRSEEEGEAMGYGYGYLGAGSYVYQRQPSQRKRRSGGDEVQQYKIVADRIEADGRTTLMIRHIPNKYTEEMLFEEIDRNHRLKINFLYLPVDHYNACNVGYAFVNFIHTKFIRDFYREFNGRRWDRFNSEKICELAYARIQGATNLMDHFNAAQARGRTAPRGSEARGRADEEGRYSDGTHLQRST